MLAHVWGLGLGMTSAYAAAGEPATDLVSRADAPALLDQLTGTAVPALERQAAPVGQVLQDRIRAGGLPLPGQATTVPDAFAIAAVLLPAVPPQPRGDGAARASRAATPGAESRTATEAGLPAQRTSDAVAGTAHLAAIRTGPGPVGAAGPQSAAVRLQNPEQPAPEDGIALATAYPVDTDGDLTAVLVPIAAGLLLTGAAMYKHRGIPRGH
ncbi:hypothetical protein GCM10010193_58430 [Kitasatospora atroaurantiaca]|uniref:Uncharacterized protein n=1 Tax=Kitasatospora atroaurantiaca TaxID=285545 RepID=A0A561EP64_9ACTN|nr:hypothetical protein FB465_2426 [Kitasatospora atroaurantiaca]